MINQTEDILKEIEDSWASDDGPAKLDVTFLIKLVRVHQTRLREWQDRKQLHINPVLKRDINHLIAEVNNECEAYNLLKD